MGCVVIGDGDGDGGRGDGERADGADGWVERIGGVNERGDGRMKGIGWMRVTVRWNGIKRRAVGCVRGYE